MMEDWDRGIYPGDVILTSEPVQVLRLDLAHERLARPRFRSSSRTGFVGWSSQFGHQMDAGGPLPGSLPTGAKTIFEEGIIIPPLKIVERGEAQEDVLRLILNNVRNPEMNRAEPLPRSSPAAAPGRRRVMELCERFGKETYLAALQALLDRTYNAMKFLISVAIPEEPQTFVDYIDDDGLGNGPYKMQLTIWREGEHAFSDWSGTDHPGPRSDQLLPLRGHVQDVHRDLPDHGQRSPRSSSDDGFYPLLHVVMPEGSLSSVRATRPRSGAAPTRSRASSTSSEGRSARTRRSSNTAAGYGTSPYMLYSGWDGSGDFFYSMEILYGGIPGRPDRRRDGRPLVVAALREHPD